MFNIFMLSMSPCGHFMPSIFSCFWFLLNSLAIGFFRRCGERRTAESEAASFLCCCCVAVLCFFVVRLVNYRIIMQHITNILILARFRFIGYLVPLGNELATIYLSSFAFLTLYWAIQ